MPVIRRFAPDALAGLFAVSGALHLARPGLYEALIPPFMPLPGAVIALSGIAELVCAAGLVRRDRWAAPVSAALLVSIFLGNLWYAVATSTDSAAPTWKRTVALLRLPLQIPLIYTALLSHPRRRATG